MSIEGEDTSVTRLTSNLNRRESWELTLEDSRRNRRSGNKKKKYVAYAVTFTIFMLWGCLATYLKSEINHLQSEVIELKDAYKSTMNVNKQEAKSTYSTFNTKILQLKSMDNDLNMKNGQLKVLVNIQDDKISGLEKKFSWIKEKLNMNSVRTDHLERILESNMLREDMTKGQLLLGNIDDKADHTSNITLQSFKDRVVQLINASELMFQYTISSFENFTDSKIDEIKTNVNDIKQDLDQITSKLDGWRMSEDQGKLYVDLKQTVDRFKLYATRKYGSCDIKTKLRKRIFL